jgi:hypothetical protein
MKIMAWNHRRLGNALTVRELLHLQKSVEADILFLPETNMDEKRMLVISVREENARVHSLIVYRYIYMIRSLLAKRC